MSDDPEQTLAQLRAEVAALRDRLLKSDTRLDRVMSVTNEGIWDWLLDEGVVFFDARYYTMAGYEPDEFPASFDAWEERVHADDLAGARVAIEEYLSGARASFEIEFRFRRKDGDYMWIWGRGKVVSHDAEGKPRRFIGTHTDITDRKRAEEGLLGEKLLADRYIDSLPGLFYVFDEERFVKWNKVWEKITGYSDEDLAGMYIPDFFEGEDREHITEKMTQVFTHGAAVAEADLVLKNGQKVPYFFNGVLKRWHGKDHLLGLGVDISKQRQAEQERRQLEGKILQAQKLESLGVLAGGIAHDFNNLLVAILGNAGLALMDLAPEATARQSIQDIETAARRAADLARQMLAYSGRGKFVIKRLDLRSLIEEMAHLLKTSISKSAVLKFDFARDVPPVEADATQIRQIVMNLIVNASEATDDRSGVIAIRTGAMECDRSYLAETYLDSDLSEGVYSYLEVSDTGCGMEAETIDRIFEPFYTTKFTGRGLGLAAVLGIVRGHQGAIKIYSEPGKGTTFKVLFPITDGPPSVEAPLPSADDRSLQGKIALIVDDEETVRAVGRRMLERFGMEAVTAEDGRQAMKIFEKSPDRFDLVLLDLTMPHLDGEETFREMRRIREDVCVVLSSGYNEQDLINRFAGKGLAGFIQKPYAPGKLRSTLLAALKNE